MSTGLRELSDHELDAALEQTLAPRLATLLQNRVAGHCARITEIHTGLAVGLSRRLRAAVSNDAQVYVLGEPPEVPTELAVSSTKLIELRNPDGEHLRPPLLVFIPPGHRASAEDSFDVATFEEVLLGDVYTKLAERLLAGLPEQLRFGVEELFDLLKEWPHADTLARCRYLLTIQHNDQDSEAAGAAVFELGLIPDFELFRDVTQVRTRSARNLAQMEILTRADRPERQRVIELQLTEPAFRSRLAEFLVRTGMDSPQAWTRRIVVDRTNWALSFHRWPLPQNVDSDHVRITVEELAALPRAGTSPDHAQHSVLQSLTGRPYLIAGSRGPAQLPISFNVEPDPRSVSGLHRFSAELVSDEAGPTGVYASVRVAKTKKAAYRVTLKKLRDTHLDAGWHYIRVLPEDVEGIPLPVEPTTGVDHPPNESERFYIVADDDPIDEDPPPRTRKHIGLTHALRDLQFTAAAQNRPWRDVACQSVHWKATQGSGRHTVLARFGLDSQVEIPLAPALVEVQRQILTEPDHLGPRRLLVHSDHSGSATSEDSLELAEDDEQIQTFVEARRAVFDLIRGDDAMVVEGCDLTRLRPAAQRYAEAYTEVLQARLAQAERAAPDQAQRLLTEVAALLRLDCIQIAYAETSQAHGDITVVAPLNPLRLLWLVAWAHLGPHWLDAVAAHDNADVAVAARSLQALTPIGFPLVVPRGGEQLAIAASDLTPYWGVCLPTDATDPQRLLADLAASLDLPEPYGGGSMISGALFADRIEQYLRLHPYVTTLSISVVNPGRGEHLADMLVELQRRTATSTLSYDVQLFSTAPQASTTGEALGQLLRGQWTTHGRADAFYTRSGSGRPQKLAVSIRPLEEFRAASSTHNTHITFLCDAFSGERFDTAPADNRGGAPVHGLRQDVDVTYIETEDDIVWHKQPRHPSSALTEPLPGAEELSDLLCGLPRVVSAASSAVTTGQVGTELAPRTTLSLTTADKTLLHQAHRSSDWVITVDRSLGVEYFDSPGDTRRPDYVIDFDAEGLDGFGHHTVVSSRSVEEMRALLTPVLGQHGLNVAPRHTATFFDQLRLLSGRLAFKLASTAANQRTEVVGLALARLYLDYQGALDDQVLVPLDAHQELYREPQARGDAVGTTVDFQRTDLALFSLNARTRTITVRLVEVKCYTTLPDLQAYEQLKDTVLRQLDRSATVLAEHFDPHRLESDRPDRAVKNAELGDLLKPYLMRALRYRTMRPSAAQEARWLLERLDKGYQLRFTRTGLTFDLAGGGTHTESEGGVEFHRVGRDLIEELLDAIPTEPAAAHAAPPESTSDGLAQLDLTVPRITDAAFQAPERSHEIPANEPLPSDDDADEGDADVEPPLEASATAAPPEASSERQALQSAQNLAPDEPAPEHQTFTAPSQKEQVDPPDTYLGSSGPSPQYGVIGETAGRRVALDLNETHTISLFGVQGGGKSYTLGSIIEAASLAAPPVNELPRPLATIVFHYSPTLDYAPEFTSMVAANDDETQVQRLRERYGVEARGLDDMVMLVPEDQLTERRSEYPGLEVLPLKFGSVELRAEHWRFLMGAVGNQSTYIRQLQRIMKAHRRDLRLETIRTGVDDSPLSDNLKQLAHQRLDLAADYIDDSVRLQDLVRPGRVIIVDLRDEFIEKDEALGLFVVLMQLFAEARTSDGWFNKLAVFDEAHKYIANPDLVDELVSTVREMRHKGTNVLVASQDPPSVPIKLIELSDHVILHKFTSPAWLKHMQKANAALNGLTSSKMAALSPGEAYVWAGKTTEVAFNRGAVKLNLRPRLTRHGGATKTATSDL
ncbi:hypothetical protein LP52_18210 [Streptomonospora alba]|uniref:ATP-binding protein n=1 Tax=Streptomonospora alba TaxID=183763 RepID=A0A0C2FEP3_9ACTN|nr:ATP-binding protein [Streptomonospora alba]KIH97639.1 hypothetical protein LP52_18210 [Streptomonospora alba]